jgi:hypothetical protein
MFGRNLFQSPQPLALMKAVRAMVHDDMTFEDAVEGFALGPASKTRNSRSSPKSPPAVS